MYQGAVWIGSHAHFSLRGHVHLREQRARQGTRVWLFVSCREVCLLTGTCHTRVRPSTWSALPLMTDPFQQSRSASEWDVTALAVEDGRCGCSASICHLVKDRTPDDGRFLLARRDGLKDHLVEMILVSLEIVTEMVVPCRVVGVTHEMEPSARNANQTDKQCIRRLDADGGKVIQGPHCFLGEIVVESGDYRSSGTSWRHRRGYGFDATVPVKLHVGAVLRGLLVGIRGLEDALQVYSDATCLQLSHGD